MSEALPLVSIVVVTYNSKAFVLETLESIRAQGYPELELILSDDGSADGTLELCREWLDQHGARFRRALLLTVPKNTGIPANSNSGARAARGQRVKYIAGEDCLTPDSISAFIHAPKPEALVLQTNAEIYRDDFQPQHYLGKFKPRPKTDFFSLPAARQHLALKYWTFLCAPAVFFQRALFDTLSFDEQFPQIEDYPFWIAVTGAGLPIRYVEITSVKYRLHGGSVQQHGARSGYPALQRDAALKQQIRAKHYPETRWVRLYQQALLQTARGPRLQRLGHWANVAARKLSVSVLLRLR